MTASDESFGQKRTEEREEERRNGGTDGEKQRQSVDPPAKVCDTLARPIAGPHPAPTEGGALGGGGGDGGEGWINTTCLWLDEEQQLHQMFSFNVYLR